MREKLPNLQVNCSGWISAASVLTFLRVGMPGLPDLVPTKLMQLEFSLTPVRLAGLANQLCGTSIGRLPRLPRTARHWLPR